MKGQRARLIVGLVLVVSGLVLLAQTLAVPGAASSVVWAFLFVAGGAAFLGLFLNNRAAWWPLIPGFVLLSLGAEIALSTVNSEVAEAWGGVPFLAGTGTAFAAVYLARRKHWWAVIVSGTFLTLALVALLDATLGGGEVAFFLGLGATFGAVYLLPATPKGSLSWAIFPTIALLALGIVTLAATTNAGIYVWPLVLIAVGAFLLIQLLFGRSKGKEPVPPPPDGTAPSHSPTDGD